MSVNGEDLNLPPPSQSHFAQFESFTPNDNASFDDEFARLASSQNWTPGSQQYTRERTIAIREEFKLHYFSQSLPLDDTDRELTEEEKLKGYQNLCHEVGIPPRDSIAECKKHLNKMLVNIVDLIDARRTLKKVKVWNDFEAFRNYTLQDRHRINMDEAKKDGGYLASLLQHLRGPRRRRRGVRSAFSSRAVSGRVTKMRPE
jgi:hypothetical protein